MDRLRSAAGRASNAEMLRGVNLTPPDGNTAIADLNGYADTITDAGSAIITALDNFVTNVGPTMAAAGYVMATTNDADAFLDAEGAYQECVDDLVGLVGMPAAGDDGPSGIFVQIKNATVAAASAKGIIAPGNGGATDQFALLGLRTLLRFPLNDLSPTNSIGATVTQIQQGTRYEQNLMQYVVSLGWGDLFNNTITQNLQIAITELANAQNLLRQGL